MRSTEHDHRNRIDLMDLVEKWEATGPVDFCYVDDVYDNAGNWLCGGHWWVSLKDCRGHRMGNIAWNLAQGCWLDTRAYVLYTVTKRLKS